MKFSLNFLVCHLHCYGEPVCLDIWEHKERVSISALSHRKVVRVAV